MLYENKLCKNTANPYPILQAQTLIKPQKGAKYTKSEIEKSLYQGLISNKALEFELLLETKL